MLVYLRDGSAQTTARAATLKQKLQIKFSTSPSHSILTPGRPVPVLALKRQVPDTVATGMPIFKSMVWPGKVSLQMGFEPRIFHSWGRSLNHEANMAVRDWPFLQVEVGTIPLSEQLSLLWVTDLFSRQRWELFPYLNSYHCCGWLTFSPGRGGNYSPIWTVIIAVGDWPFLQAEVRTIPLSEQLSLLWVTDLFSREGQTHLQQQLQAGTFLGGHQGVLQLQPVLLHLNHTLHSMAYHTCQYFSC